LKESAKDWYHTLAPGSITTWVELKKAFLEKYFPATKSNQLKKKISNIEQFADESLYDYYERFKKLVKPCPYHGYQQIDLVLYLHGGLREDDRRLVNASCGGNILKMTHDEAMTIFATLADNSRQYTGRGSSKKSVSSVSQVDKDEFALLKEEVRRLRLKGMPQQVKACELCHDDFHPTDACPTLHEEVNAVGFQQQGQQRPNYNGQYNRDQPCRNHLNFRWSDLNNQLNPPVQPQFAPRPQAPQSSADEMLKALVQSNIQINEHIQKLGSASVKMQETHKVTTDNLEKQIGQLAQVVGQIQQQLSGRLPSQTEKNPDIRNVSALIVQEEEIEEEFEGIMEEFLGNLEISEGNCTVCARLEDFGDRRSR